jgi:hypothetical protein
MSSPRICGWLGISGLPLIAPPHLNHVGHLLVGQRVHVRTIRVIAVVAV